VTPLRDARRKPWIAALLSLLLPGVGHMYSGALERGFIVLCVWWIIVVAMFALTAILPAWIGAFLPYVLILAGLAAVMIDAARTARRAPRPFIPQSYNRWYVYLVVPVLAGPTIFGPIAALVRKNFYEAYKIPTISMAPTILSGDYIYATRLRGAVQRGDNVVYHHHGVKFVKRVVGLPGDTITMRNERVFVNARPTVEPYVTLSDDDPRANWGPLVVPTHSYFVLGDNRGQSVDSREYGPIDADSVTQRPIGIYFSKDPASGAIRWNRIGRNVSH
jgi:signal peptidase I